MHQSYHQPVCKPTRIYFLYPKKLSLKACGIFTRQLATLLTAGFPLAHSLSLLNKQERNPFMRTILTHLVGCIETGSSLSNSLATYPKIFSAIYINMVKAGEAGGILALTLTRLATFQEKSQRTRKKIIAAMCYPLIVLLLAFSILTFLFTFIIPKFEIVFADMLSGQSLPFLTQVILSLSTSVKNNVPIITGSILLLVGFIYWLHKTPSARYQIDSWKLRLPLLGNLIRKRAIVQFTGIFGTLIAQGVPILQSLDITREAVGNATIARSIDHLYAAIQEGEPIAPPLEISGIFPPMVVSMLHIGEETGKLAEMLEKVTEIYDAEIDTDLSTLISLIEPLMIIFLALVVGVIVTALFLPLIGIINGIQTM